MKITKWDPFNRIDRFFDDSFSPYFSGIASMGFDMAVDVYEENNKVIAKMNLPGVEVDELDISIEDNILTVSGSRNEEKEVDEKDYYSKEIKRGSFSRSLSLPKSVDAKKAQAHYEKGELSITMPAIQGQEDKAVKVSISS